MGNLPGGDESDAYAVNDQADIIGWSNTSSGQEPVCWMPVVPWSHRFARRRGHQRIGAERQGPGSGLELYRHDQLHAFLWTATGGMVDLGTLPGDDVSEATR